MAENTIISNQENIWSEEFKTVPSLEVDDYRILGTPNGYDNMFSDFRVDPVTIDKIKDSDFALCSGYYKRIVEYINLEFRPKDGTGISSWYSNKDYSDDSRFEKYWDVRYNDEALWYELADLFGAIISRQEYILSQLDYLTGR